MSISKMYQRLSIFLFSLCVTSFAFAEGEKNIGTIAQGISKTLSSVGQLMVAVAYLAGFGFLMFGILKFKQHKDNPQQVTLGVPVVMTIIGSVLLFVGAFIAPLGESLGIETDKAKQFSVPDVVK